MRCVEKSIDCFGFEWAGEQESLAGVAVLALECSQLGSVLDALTEGFETQRLAELDERVDQCWDSREDAIAGDERAVDFESVDRELAQVGERAVAGAEVVDRDPHTERLERAAAAARRPSASRISAVSVISSVSRARVDAGDRERVGDVVDEVGLCPAGGRRR